MAQGQRLFHVSAGSKEPVYLQLMRQVKHAVTAGVLKAGDQMPTARALAEELGMNLNTVARAYRELGREGLLEAGPGRGTFVKAALPLLLAQERRRRLKPLMESLVSEARLLGLSGAELRGLLQEALRRHGPIGRT
jgi:GntR family transcriptional regulator